MPPYTFMNQPVAKALYSALILDPFYITLEKQSFKDPKKAKQAMFCYMDYALKEAKDHGRVVFTQDRTSGASIWAKPMDTVTEKKLSDRKKDFIDHHLGRDSLRAYCTMVDFMAGQSQGLVPGQSWYLSILGIAPNCQGKGLGKSIMTKVLRQIDDLGRAVYAESFTPKNFRFYQNLGFEPVKTIKEPFTAASYTILLRPPKVGNQ
ncbi:MAG: GNAT family N-acetyltransferase [Desulfobacter sp.]|nr:GNAT family N-acetyltransferase [Desulfobacter sp.]WDP85263.1 MAG: GNAT family N-acetyltransferase [Desulfobacter sp.]